jgi:hypothetical protein
VDRGGSDRREELVWLEGDEAEENPDPDFLDYKNEQIDKEVEEQSTLAPPEFCEWVRDEVLRNSTQPDPNDLYVDHDHELHEVYVLRIAHILLDGSRPRVRVEGLEDGKHQQRRGEYLVRLFLDDRLRVERDKELTQAKKKIDHEIEQEKMIPFCSAMGS